MPDDIQHEAPAQSTAVTVLERAKVALRASEREQQLVELAQQSAAIVAITNPAGYQECHASRMALKRRRIEIERDGESAREDAKAFAKGVIAEQKRLIAIIEPEEHRLQALQDEHDAKVEAEKEAKRQAEAARVKAIRDKIEAIRLTPLTVLGESSALIAEKVADLQSRTVTSDEFTEFVFEAAQARTDALDALGKAYDAAVAAEAAAAQLAEQQAELTRQRAEQDEANRKAEEKRDADEAAARAERERQDAIARQEREEADRRSREARQTEDRERERRATIRGKIDDLRSIPNDLVGSPAVSIQAWIDRVRADPPDAAAFAEFLDEATQAHEAVLARLATMFNAQLEVETERAHLAWEAAALAERQRQEREALEAKAREEAAAQQAERERVQREESEHRRAADQQAIRELAVNPEAALREILHVCADQSYTPGDAIKRVSAIAQAMLDVYLMTSVTISGAPAESA